MLDGIQIKHLYFQRFHTILSLIVLIQEDSTDNADLKPIIDEITNIEYNFARKKRSAGNRARQSAGTEPGTQLYLNKNNMVDNVVINLKKLLGTDTFENFYYYDVSITNTDTKYV